MDEEQEYGRFIDVDEQEGYSDDITYETIVIKQIQRCVDILSQEEYGGYFKISPKGETYIEDVKENVINAVDTLRMIILPFFTNDDIEEVTKKLNEIKSFQEEYGNKIINIKGRGFFKIKDIKMLEKTSPIMKEFTDFKCLKHRELFEILVKIYHKRKLEIAATSIDG